MKKYNIYLAFGLLPLVFAVVFCFAVGSIFDADAYMSNYEELVNRPVADNLILFSPAPNNQNEEFVSDSINTLNGLKGYIPYKNGINGILGAVIFPDFIFNEGYIELKEGRMPVFERSDGLVEMIASCNGIEVELGAKYDLTIVDKTTNVTKTQTCIVVGLTDNQYLFESMFFSFAMHDISKQTGIELLPDKYEGGYLLFNSANEKDNAIVELEKSGAIIRYKTPSELYVYGNAISLQRGAVIRLAIILIVGLFILIVSLLTLSLLKAELSNFSVKELVILIMLPVVLLGLSILIFSHFYIFIYDIYSSTYYYIFMLIGSGIAIAFSELLLISRFLISRRIKNDTNYKPDENL